MSQLYSIFTLITWNFLKVLTLLHPKLKLFVKGRKQSFGKLQQAIKPEDQVIWMHVASLGEYEQGLPILEKLKKERPYHKIVLTFFSPSGYEVKKDSALADVVLYLPMDTISNAKKFLDLAQPVLAIFIKYEIWPNYLKQLQQRNIPCVLVSAIFSKRQVYFKPYGGFMRKALKRFTHFFVQEKDSKTLLQTLGHQNVTLCGDTRFDRVSKILEQDNSLGFMAHFTANTPCFVAGSTWPEDEKILTAYINKTTAPLKYVLAPHNIKANRIAALEKSIHKKVVRYSTANEAELAQAQVLILDTIGLLTKVYSYAHIAYVGGGFATGLHNTLEPAVFGIPVIIGPQYHKFNEAVTMVKRKGLLSVDGSAAFTAIVDQLLAEPAFTQATGQKNTAYVAENLGATQKVMDYIGGVVVNK